MTASERSLAEEITEGLKALKRIRQLEAEIELLEAKRLAAYNIGYEDGNKAQAERQVKETLDTRSYLMGRYDTSPGKELTDMEIIEVANKFKNLEWAVVAFARAILRKAQEK
jgi:hypothetical protein